MNNWVMEIRKWCPELRCVAFHGPQTERDRIKREQLILGHFDVMATTYEMLVADTHTCQRFHWGYIVLDEAHRIKNEKTLMGQAVRRLRSSQRLLITGTPLQNNLHELWALLNFMLPEQFDDADAFDTFFESSEKKEKVTSKVCETWSRTRSHTRKTPLVAPSPHAPHTHEHSSERSQPRNPEPQVYINS